MLLQVLTDVIYFLFFTKRKKSELRHTFSVNQNGYNKLDDVLFIIVGQRRGTLSGVMASVIFITNIRILD